VSPFFFIYPLQLSSPKKISVRKKNIWWHLSACTFPTKLRLWIVTWCSVESANHFPYISLEKLSSHLAKPLVWLNTSGWTENWIMGIRSSVQSPRWKQAAFSTSLQVNALHNSRRWQCVYYLNFFDRFMDFWTHWFPVFTNAQDCLV